MSLWRMPSASIGMSRSLDRSIELPANGATGFVRRLPRLPWNLGGAHCKTVLGGVDLSGLQLSYVGVFRPLDSRQ